MAMTTVGDVINQARRLALDVSGNRYNDDYFYSALNMALLECYRLRPDMFRGTDGLVPQYSAGDVGVVLNVGPYVPAIVLFIVGMVQLTDDEGNEDPRAVSLMNAFTAKLVNHVA